MSLSKYNEFEKKDLSAGHVLRIIRTFLKVKLIKNAYDISESHKCISISRREFMHAYV